ncbi:hypothetical protein DL768_003462 [Monosporascus sp. mg162]|nr:hypothetical protein DL768_003462 [Monosporascus sp. mg162]
MVQTRRTVKTPLKIPDGETSYPLMGVVTEELRYGKANTKDFADLVDHFNKKLFRFNAEDMSALSEFGNVCSNQVYIAKVGVCSSYPPWPPCNPAGDEAGGGSWTTEAATNGARSAGISSSAGVGKTPAGMIGKALRFVLLQERFVIAVLHAPSPGRPTVCSKRLVGAIVPLWTEEPL